MQTQQSANQKRKLPIQRAARPSRTPAMGYTVIIEQGRESGYVAHVPALRGCVSQGATKRLALANVKEAIEAYIEALIEDGLPVPTEAGREVVEVQVAAR